MAATVMGTVPLLVKVMMLAPAVEQAPILTLPKANPVGGLTATLRVAGGTVTVADKGNPAGGVLLVSV
jgi:Mg/Co/Ni transporter MgtE